MYAKDTSTSYNKWVRLTKILPRQLVLKKKANQVAVGKLESKWEGLYLVKHRSRTGLFRLATLEGKELSHYWNVASLKRYFVQTWVAHVRHLYIFKYSIVSLRHKKQKKKNWM